MCTWHYSYSFIYLFIYLWLCWVFISVRGLSLAVASGGHSASRCAGLSLSRPLLLRSTGSRRAGSVIVAHGPSCSAACRIFPDQGSNPCLLHWQADSQPLRHQGSPILTIFKCTIEGHWVQLQCCTTITTIHFQNFFIIPSGNSVPIKYPSLPPAPGNLCSPFCLYRYLV